MSEFTIPASTTAEQYNIETKRGRANLFKKRIEELTKPKTQGGPGLTTDQAVHELRISENPDDQKLLTAMGEPPSDVRTDRLKQAKWRSDMMERAERNAQATKTSPEVSTAAKLATNIAHGRALAFNARIDEIQSEARENGGREISLDDAIRRMRAKPADAALLKAMEDPAVNDGRA
ncbi:MAG TPA: hypothetical protein VHW03_05370 [Chthoniobacterales bacterium]|jgi:hypothetical protein|nr:hypothetical protein [Chthoniobacterales bacterium]